MADERKLQANSVLCAAYTASRVAILGKVASAEVCQAFDSKSEAQAWAGGIESQMVRGVFISLGAAERTTMADVLPIFASHESVPKV